MAYFLISVSNRVNLELCIKYALAGFTNSINGLWTFCEICEGDYISFLYGARVFNLYEVVEKKAYGNAEKLPPWPSVTFKTSGKTYYFPFRLFLKPIRQLDESMVKPEFSYVAENLLLRGGYRKTHFQADQTTFHAVSQLGRINREFIHNLTLDNSYSFVPKFTWALEKVNPPEVFKFHELILQAIIRRHLSDKNKLQEFFKKIGRSDLNAEDFEVLSEKAFPEGHVDILIKDAYPAGASRKIVVEVKAGDANIKDIEQLTSYKNEIADECLFGILISKHFSKKILEKARNYGIICFNYSFEEIDKNLSYSFQDLESKLSLTVQK